MNRTTSSRNAELLSELARRVTGRDRAICEALYEHRVLTTAQLAQLCFDSEDRARDRLAQLHQLGVLERFRPYRQHGSYPYHYLLARNGAELLAAGRGIDPAELDFSRAAALRLASSQQLRHLTEASGFFTRLAQALRTTPGAALEAWWGQRRCARAWGELIRPDGYARLALPRGALELWLEWDRATEPLGRLREKHERYQELELALEQPLTVLFVAPGHLREQHILKAAEETGDLRLLVTTAERHHADPLAANWLRAGADRRLALGELATAQHTAEPQDFIAAGEPSPAALPPGSPAGHANP